MVDLPPRRLVVVLLGIALLGSEIQTEGPRSQSNPYRQSEGGAACGPGPDLRGALDKFSSDLSPETVLIRKSLIQKAEQSTPCRDEIVHALMQAMNKPNLNFVADRRSFYLWSNGAAILGDLKAVEALDLLIEHLDLSDGAFSASMAHQPAFLGVTLMGAAAIPKLRVALREGKSRDIRLASALCLLKIDGPDVGATLEQSLSSEADQCVRHFLETAIAITHRESESKSRPLTESERNDLIDLRRKLLMSFRCV